MDQVVLQALGDYRRDIPGDQAGEPAAPLVTRSDVHSVAVDPQRWHDIAFHRCGNGNSMDRRETRLEGSGGLGFRIRVRVLPLTECTGH